jgi:HD-like signal output (HDOD) protein
VKPATSKLLEKKICELGNLPAMPTVLQSLGECLSADPSDANVQKVIDLISCDKSLAAQCLRLANSPLLRGRVEADSVKAAVMALGLRRVRDVVYSCGLPNLFSSAKHGMAHDTFWRHAMGTALVTQRLAQRLAVQSVEKLYLGGLLHDIGILVNSLLFKKDFQVVFDLARNSETPLCEVEEEVLGFTHCDSGRVLADVWKLPADISATIEFHHHPSPEETDADMNCLVYLADLLCRLRGLGYGYYEAREFDLASEVAWGVLAKKYPAAAALDLARFTFELDEYAIEVQGLVDSIFGVKVAEQEISR